MITLTRARPALIAASVALLLAACGDGDAGGDSGTAAPPVDSAAGSSTTPEAPTQEQAAEAGSATVTVGNTTWTFDSALCAVGEEAIGQEGAEFVLSSIQDDVQFYLSIDSYGHRASVDDIADQDDPSVVLSTADASGEFIQVDGTRVTGEADFVDYTTDSLEGIPGSFEATCP